MSHLSETPVKSLKKSYLHLQRNNSASGTCQKRVLTQVDTHAALAANRNSINDVTHICIKFFGQENI